MTTRYGRDYEATKHLPLTGVAKLIRARLKSRWPEYRFSVRTSHRGARSMTVELTSGWAGDVYSPAWLAKERLLPHDNAPRPFLYSAPARTLLRDVESEVEAFNFDGSEPESDYFHVRFYGEVRFRAGVVDAAKSRLEARLLATLQDARVALLAGDKGHVLRVLETLEGSVQS
ncbi:MAG: LPD29 domain-containing protein [Myxococcales bacterium]|nr:LPD29 domain-containing protein [Myxococcales bacterium]